MEKIIVSDALDKLFTENLDKNVFYTVISHRLSYMGDLHKILLDGTANTPSQNIGFYQDINKDFGLTLMVRIISAFPQYICRFIYRQLPSAFGYQAIEISELNPNVNKYTLFIFAVENIIKYASCNEYLLKNNIDYATEFWQSNGNYVDSLVLENNGSDSLSYEELAEFAQSCENPDVLNILHAIFQHNVKICELLE